MIHQWRASRSRDWVLTTVLSSLLGAQAACANDRRPTDTAANDGLTLMVLPTSDGQAGLPDMPLPAPLQVRVLEDGQPRAGVRVRWKTDAGVMLPSESLSGEDGIATTMWMLGAYTPKPIATATVDGAKGEAATFRARTFANVQTVIVEASNSQSAEVEQPLARPLEVRVMHREGPLSGLRVFWSTNAGTITASSVTDQDGVARATWTMSTLARVVSAVASLQAPVSPRSATFTARATAGAVAQVRPVYGDGLAFPSNARNLFELALLATDRFGNPVSDVPVVWVIESGPVDLVRSDASTDAHGVAHASVRAAGSQGLARISAGAGAAVAPARFSMTASAPTYMIVMQTNQGYSFRSVLNGTVPAVDTVAVGATVIWELDPFDYDSHDITIVDGPALPAGGEFPYASPSQVKIRFTVAGTYHYVDTYYGGRGTLVVQP